MNKDLVVIFDYLEKEKGIKRETLIEAIEESLVAAAKKSVKGSGTVSVHVDPKSGEIEVLAEKEVVEKVSYFDEEIALDQAREIAPNCSIGEWVSVPVTPSDFGRIAAKTARQIIAQKLRCAEREVIYEEYRHRVHELVFGTVKHVTKGTNLIVDLGKVEAILPKRFYPETERYHIGDRVQALLWEVRDTENGGAEIVLSRKHAEFVAKLFVQEVPELRDHIVEIKKIVREAGYRTKMMVSSNDSKVDPLGSCVGVRGSRIKNVIRELNNEKIDIVIYQEDRNALLHSLLNPIEPKQVHLDLENGLLSLVVKDEDYPIVIGKKGMNVRLNAELMNVDIECKRWSVHQQEVMFECQQQQLDQDRMGLKLTEIEGVNKLMLDSLLDAGFETLGQLFSTPFDEIIKVSGLSQEMVQHLLNVVREAIRK